MSAEKPNEKGVERQAALFMFDLSTEMAKPWADAGIECWCVDLQHPRGEHRIGNIVRVGADAMAWLPPRRDWIFAAFFPPCTDVAVSGARWFRDKGLGAIIQALTLFKRSVDMAEMLGCPYLIENPVSTVSTYWRKPDHSFHPWQFAGYCPEDHYTKKTNLWTGGGFTMPQQFHEGLNAVPDNRIHFASPGPDRANIRSKTPRGFAQAVFQANMPADRLAA